MKMTNNDMYQVIEVMSRLNETGKLGYAIARNLRVLKTAATEYIHLRNKLFEDYGETEGNIKRIPDENLEAFLAKLGDIPGIEHEVEIFKVSEEDFLSGSLKSNQMEALLFMVDTGEAKEEKKDTQEEQKPVEEPQQQQ